MSGAWIQTYSGRQFFPLAPRPEDVCIFDIAHALSNLCRFAGHSRVFYSVAQHSIHVSQLCPPEDALHGLLHDAAEAYCVDLPRPLKHSPEMHNYRVIEKRIERAVEMRFRLGKTMPESVTAADDAMLMAERRDLFVSAVAPWSTEHVSPADRAIVPLHPGLAEARFLARYTQLMDLRNSP